MKALAKKLARLFLGEYSAYYIYALSAGDAVGAPAQADSRYRMASADELRLKSSADVLIQAQSGYAGPGSRTYVLYDGDRIIGVCFYWFGARYLTRNFWPLAEGEAKLVQIVVLPEMRGRGAAGQLIAASMQDMAAQGFNRAYARIWHSNVPSLRAFERSGWMRVALVLEINPFRRARPLQFRLRVRGRPAQNQQDSRPR